MDITFTLHADTPEQFQVQRKLALLFLAGSGLAAAGATIPPAITTLPMGDVILEPTRAVSPTPSAAPAPAPAEKPKKEKKEKAAPVAAAAADPMEDLLGETPAPAAAPATTLDDLKNAMREIAVAFGKDGIPKAKEVLAEFKVERLADLPPDRFAAMHAALLAKAKSAPSV